MKTKILVPTNFSQKSESALNYALRLSTLQSSEVYLFHVFESSMKNFSKVDQLNGESMDRMKVSMNEAIDYLHSQGIEHQVEEVHRRVANGKPAEEIFKMALGVSADLVVMGAPTSRGFKKFGLKAPCTLVLVKDKSAL